MNEIQIIQNQLAIERLHFAEVATVCASALDKGNFRTQGELATACADYFAFAVTRLPGMPTPPGTDAPAEDWREFLRDFNEQTARHFAAVDQLLPRNIPVTEWRARSRIDADSIVTERARYARVKAAVP